MPTTSSHPTDRRNIRDAALWMTGCGWVLGFCVSKYLGEPTLRALALSAIQILGGLAAWWCYHVISRRNDGMLIIMMAVQPSLQSHPERPFSSEIIYRVVGFVVAVVFAIAIAVVVRTRVRKALKPAAAPLWDDEIDQPPLTPRVEPHPRFEYDVEA